MAKFQLYNPLARFISFVYSVLRSYLSCIDKPLFSLLLLLAGSGLLILYSATNQNLHVLTKQSIHLLTGFMVMSLFARIPAHYYYRLAPWIYSIGLLLLITILLFGNVHQGARRWLDLRLFNLQASEIMKIALPLMLAAYLSDKNLADRGKYLITAGLLLLIPTLLILKQPDLGTAILIACSGFWVLFLAGLSWRFLMGSLVTLIICSPLVWHFMHHYQRQRVLTFFNPEQDPLGNGYHIIQSKIAIGSGGLLGKGWLHGTQSHLQFLPAHATDFIFAVSSEEFGLLGSLALIVLLLVIFWRCLHISWQARNHFAHLLSASLSATFAMGALINMGMVVGILPVVGIPLALISYGGSSMTTTMIVFGILMSVRAHRGLWTQ